MHNWDVLYFGDADVCPYAPFVPCILSRGQAMAARQLWFGTILSVAARSLYFAFLTCSPHGCNAYRFKMISIHVLLYTMSMATLGSSHCSLCISLVCLS